MPLKEISKEAQKARWGSQFFACGFNIAFKDQHLAFEFTIAPKTEGIAVGIDQVGQCLQFFPLLLIMLVCKASRVGPFAGCFNFYGSKTVVTLLYTFEYKVK